MTDEFDKVTEEELHAYVDGQLPPEREEAVRTFLKADAQARARVEGWLEQNKDLRRIFDGRVDERVPERLDPTRIAKGIKPANDGWNRAPGFRAIAASVCLLLVGAAGGWFASQATLPGGQPVEAVAQLAMNAHEVYAIDQRHPVEVTADQSQHLVKWLSKRLGTRLIAPDLSDHGFSLVGGRLLAATEGAAAQFMYQDAEGQRVTLFVSPSRTDQLASFEFTSKGMTHAFYWLDSSLNYALVGTVSRDQLLGLATRLYAQWTQQTSKAVPDQPA